MRLWLFLLMTFMYSIILIFGSIIGQGKAHGHSFEHEIDEHLQDYLVFVSLDYIFTFIIVAKSNYYLYLSVEEQNKLYLC